MIGTSQLVVQNDQKWVDYWLLKNAQQKMLVLKWVFALACKNQQKILEISKMKSHIFEIISENFQHFFGTP
jgi:hypothetical protein